MLIDNTLFGSISKIDTAINRITSMEPSDGYYVAFSGGKDSIVVLDLIKTSGVSYDAHFNLTTVDPPELLVFIKKNYPDVEWSRPEKSMKHLIVEKRLPPTRKVRYCCRSLKERGGNGRMVVTGIRWSESSSRSKRSSVELCNRTNKRFLHPIIDWTDEDVWEYIRENHLPYPSLYDEGFKRIGCVMCPLSGSKVMKNDAERWPRIATMYKHACIEAYDRSIEDGLDRGQWASGEDMYEWWLNYKYDPTPEEQECFFLDN